MLSRLTHVLYYDLYLKQENKFDKFLLLTSGIITRVYNQAQAAGYNSYMQMTSSSRQQRALARDSPSHPGSLKMLLSKVLWWKQHKNAVLFCLLVCFPVTSHKDSRKCRLLILRTHKMKAKKAKSKTKQKIPSSKSLHNPATGFKHTTCQRDTGEWNQTASC